VGANSESRLKEDLYGANLEAGVGHSCAKCIVRAHELLRGPRKSSSYCRKFTLYTVRCGAKVVHLMCDELRCRVMMTSVGNQARSAVVSSMSASADTLLRNGSIESGYELAAASVVVTCFIARRRAHSKATP
jgi:hypothetical protein